MKLIHTSDWHLGRSLYGRKRYQEFEAFLSWLAETIEQEQIDALLVAGDIFDTTTPSNRAQELYYRFLCRVAASCCRHVVVISGNHDSPSFLDAPRELLRTLNVHVIGAAAENCADEVLLLKKRDSTPELIVCAIPYLRDRDIRIAETGETIADKERKLLEGIRRHYAEVCELAEKQREALGTDIPIIGMGHLFTAGGQTVDGDGVRELYIGSLAHVTADIFPPCIDYLALGHLHVPQKVQNSAYKRYSGSPLAMGFGEAKQQKSVCRIEFVGRQASVTTLVVPRFQALERLQGNWQTIHSKLQKLAAEQSQAWLEIIYEGEEIVSDLREQLENTIADTKLEILRVKNKRIVERILSPIQQDETLDDLNVHEVFERCLDRHEVPPEQRAELVSSYQEILHSLDEQDLRAE